MDNPVIPPANATGIGQPSPVPAPVPDPRNMIFSAPDVAPAPGTPPTSLDAPKPTKMLSSSGGKLEVNWEELTQNKYAIGGAIAIATMLALVFSKPSFVKKDDSTDFQSVAILGALAFIAVVWGPAIFKSAKGYLGK